MSSSALFEAILARRSVRRYCPDLLDESTLAQVERILAVTQPLVAGHCFGVIQRTPSGQDLVASLGGYGRLVNPPHYLVPYMSGSRHILEDLGFRCEQIVVRLTMLGLGSCFIGCLGREAAVRRRFSLPDGAHIAAFIAFGRPTTSLGGRAVNALVRRATGATHKLPAERLFYRDRFDTPSLPPADLVPLIEAGRHAPSALDVQPWRFLWHEGRLSLFVRRHNPGYGPGQAQAYRLHDGGLAMGNIALALSALGRPGRWQLYDQSSVDIPPHPEELEPLGYLDLDV
ncbi:MAG: nitroreductase family protein [Anaerolineae bacterium]